MELYPVVGNGDATSDGLVALLFGAIGTFLVLEDETDCVINGDRCAGAGRGGGGRAGLTTE